VIRIRFRAIAVVGAAVLAAGCARLGLNPLPANTETGGMEHGLNPFPEPMHPKGTADVGLDPFPNPVHSGESSEMGITPFPKQAAKEDKDGKFGMDPFPKPMHKGVDSNLGLNPFPKGEQKTGAAAAMAKGSSKTAMTDVPVSEEYPDEPPVVLPPTPDRSGQAGEPKKKKRPAWKDE
jgi:hypothetical protein